MKQESGYADFDVKIMQKEKSHLMAELGRAGKVLSMHIHTTTHRGKYKNLPPPPLANLKDYTVLR